MKLPKLKNVVFAALPQSTRNLLHTPLYLIFSTTVNVIFSVLYFSAKNSSILARSILEDRQILSRLNRPDPIFNTTRINLTNSTL